MFAFHKRFLCLLFILFGLSISADYAVDMMAGYLHTPREIGGIAGDDVLICLEELAGHAVIDADGGAASGLTIGQHDGAIILITQS